MEGKKVYICLAISILAIVIPLFFRDYTMFEIICYSFFSLFLVIGATIDKLYYILPDEGALALTIIGIVYSISEQYAVIDTCVHVSIVACISVALRMLSKGGLGWGDIKWISAISIWLTSIQILVMVYVSFLTSILYLAGLYITRNTRSRYIPFGPFLCIGAWSSLHFYNLWEALYLCLIQHIQITVMALY